MNIKENEIFGWKLTKIANFNNNFNLYCRIEKFYTKLKPKMIKEAQNGNHYISFLIYDFTKREDDLYEALSFLEGFTTADGLELKYNFPESSLINIVW